MQTSNERASERRKSSSPRIPVDLLVSLTPVEELDEVALLDSWSTSGSSLGESYDADALDLSPEGLRVRATVLPDVGQELHCRFELPDTGETCETRGRVVWSNDSGREGEFAITFEGRSPELEEALARFTIDRGPSTLDDVNEWSGDEAQEAAEAPHEPADVAHAQAGAPSIARLLLDGVASPVDAEVIERDELRLDVAQALPFFSIGRGANVECDGDVERRRVESVSLRIEDGVPKLVLGLVAEVSSSAGFVAAPTDEADALEGASPDSTLQDSALDELLARAVPSDEVASAAAQTVRSRSRARRALEGDVEPSLFSASDVSLDDDAAVIAAHREKKLDEVRRILLAAHDEADGDEGEVAIEPAGRLAGLDVRAHWERAKERATETWEALRERGGPRLSGALTRALAAIRAGYAFCLTHAGPSLRRAREAILAFFAQARARLTALTEERLPKLAARLRGTKEVRRTTTAPPPSDQNIGASTATRRARRSSVAAEREPARPRLALRWVLLAILVFGAVVSLAYALGAGSEAPTPIVVPTHASASAELADDVALADEASARAPSAAAAEPTPSATPSAPREPLAPAPSTSALGEPTSDHGRLPMPGYPSIERATATPAAAPAAEASSSDTSAATAAAPSAAPAVTTGNSFGSERVTGGQTTALRMSVAPSVLEGQASADGFIVTIRGALSLDRAAPIARSNPAVDRASILNRGDHSVLEVRFVEGRTPPYRVAIRGQAVEVTIGR